MPCWSTALGGEVSLALGCGAPATAALLPQILELAMETDFDQYCSAPGGDQNVTGHESLSRLRNHKHGQHRTFRKPDRQVSAVTQYLLSVGLHRARSSDVSSPLQPNAQAYSANVARTKTCFGMQRV